MSNVWATKKTKMDIQTKLYVAQIIWEWFSCDNKPAYIGIWILELSKVLMYEFHYDYIKIGMVTTTIIHRHWQFNVWK